MERKKRNKICKKNKIILATWGTRCTSRHVVCFAVWQDFGSIFSTLLPGSKAKLIAPEGLSILDGLEFKVAFGDVWKESLGELSGGQRRVRILNKYYFAVLF